MTRYPHGSCPKTMGIPYSCSKLTLSLSPMTLKLKYRNTLVIGKAKTVTAEFAYCGAMHKDELRTLERKFGQPQAVVSAHLDKPSSFPPLKMHNSDNIIN